MLLLIIINLINFIIIVITSNWGPQHACTPRSPEAVPRGVPHMHVSLCFGAIRVFSRLWGVRSFQNTRVYLCLRAIRNFHNASVISCFWATGSFRGARAC